MLEYKSSRVQDVNLLEQVLSQGEALRASLMHTILKNEPLYLDNSKTPFPSPVSQNARDNDVELSLPEKHACLAYMNGDPMSREDEQQALNTFRSLSGSDICDLTSRSFATTQNGCKCETCRSYSKLNTNSVPPLHFKRSGSTKSSGKVTFSSRSAQKHDNFEVFQYADSLKVVLHSFAISQEGKVKLYMAQSVKQKPTAPTAEKFNELNVTYFVEYEIPIGIVKYPKRQSRVDSGLNSVNFVKKCSKNIVKNVVYFKHATTHDISNLDIVNLEDVEVIFKVTARTLREKKAIVLGTGKFNFAEFYDSPTLSCLQEVTLYLSDDSPIISGSIRIQLQLGCDRLYFGKEFIDSLQNTESRTKIDQKASENLDETFTFTVNEVVLKKNVPRTPNKVKTKEHIQLESKTQLNKKAEINLKCKQAKTTNIEVPTQNDDDSVCNIGVAPLNEKLILFGFIFVSDVEYQQQHAQTYFTCQPFCQQDFVVSNVMRGGWHTCFNYHQVIPYVYDEAFLFNLRENHMILEFFSDRSEVIGISKVPLHQYYLAYRNPVIIKYLARSHLPVIGTDWYEPIKDVTSGADVGNAQVLVALGTEEQVRNLQKERGFMDDIVKRTKCVIDKAHVDVVVREKSLVKRKSHPKVHTLQTQTETVETPRCTVDKSTAVTPSLELGTNLTVEAPKMEDCNKTNIVTVDYRLQAIQDYLQQLVALKASSQSNAQVQTTIENTGMRSDFNVNTVNTVQNDAGQSQSRSTSGLLETLQDVINLDAQPRHVFKAQIVVECALHLPARKKCRARKVKGKIIREELLPSTYVSYEIKDGVVKTSQVVQKTTGPIWNLRNEVSLPIDYLTNSNRRLLFKVWRKSNNGSTIPNMQIDTIIGFATVDLTVLLAGLPTIEGWFNIMDFTNKCNGQIKINVSPLEDISKFSKATNTAYTTTPTLASTPNNKLTTETTTATTTPSSDGTTASPDETFSRALKRKFIELEEISQRLKARLNHVTEDLPPEDDQDVNDESADEFEKDINTLCVEEDYDLLDFAKEAQDMNMRRVSCSLQQWKQDNSNTQGLMITTDDPDDHNDHNSNVEEEIGPGEPAPESEPTLMMKTFIPESQKTDPATTTSSSTSTLDRQLNEGKERIDHLLQRLTLLSSAQKTPLDQPEIGTQSLPLFPSAGRCVSGCSTSQDHNPISSTSSATIGSFNLEQDILTELGIERDFDPRKLFNASLESFNGNLEALLGRSLRDAPDGEGNTTESSADDKLN